MKSLGRLFLWSSLTTFLVAPTASAQEIPEWDIAALRAQGAREGWSFEVRESWVTEHLRRGGDLRDITGLEMPHDWREGARFVNLAVDPDLPAAFDWRAEVEGGLQPIRNQKQCGSCWAFAVTAVLESLIRIKDPASDPDLAEQTLVSTCSNSGSCNGGYFRAFDYLRKPGLPREEDDPYVARNTSCRRGLQPAGKIIEWAYIGSGNRAPTTEQLKTAIYQYGPIAVTVNASFGSYASGIYNRCNTGGVNHMVTLEGWNDEGQYWIMRNSWGANWGEQGYMRIRYTSDRGYKCNNIGQTAAFAVLEPETLSRR